MFNGPGKLSEIMRCFEGRRRKSQYWLNGRAQTGRMAVGLRISASPARTDETRRRVLTCTIFVRSSGGGELIYDTMPWLNFWTLATRPALVDVFELEADRA
jgi:hypothetical protein